MRALRTLLAVALILVGLAGLLIVVDGQKADQRERDEVVDSLSALVIVYADGLTVALDEVVKCELSKPGHIVFPSDTIVRPVRM